MRAATDAQPNPAPDSTTPTSAWLASTSASEAPEPTPAAKRLRHGSRFHIVQPGDSLWSIAKQLVGPNATAGRIAREVDRLWTLNRSRIATGDPDLLLVGTRLRLR
jgi:Tfp pilus assembly protein FimV